PPYGNAVAAPRRVTAWCPDSVLMVPVARVCPSPIPETGQATRDSFQESVQGLRPRRQTCSGPSVPRSRTRRVRLPRRRIRLRQIDLPAARAARVALHVRVGVRRRPRTGSRLHLEGAAAAAPDRVRLPRLPPAAQQNGF